MPARSPALEPQPDQVKRGSGLCGRVRCGVVVPACRGRRGAALPPAWEPASTFPGALSARPPGGAGHRRPRAPVGAPPGRRRVRGAVLRRPAWVTPPWPPTPTRLGAELAGGRRPRSRPASAGPAGPQISAHFCSGIGRDQILHPDRCQRLAPELGGVFSSTGDGERSEQVVACHGGPEKEGVPRSYERTTWPQAHLGAGWSRSRVPRPAVRLGLC